MLLLEHFRRQNHFSFSAQILNEFLLKHVVIQFPYLHKVFRIPCFHFYEFFNVLCQIRFFFQIGKFAKTVFMCRYFFEFDRRNMAGILRYDVKPKTINQSNSNLYSTKQQRFHFHSEVCLPFLMGNYGQRIRIIHFIINLQLL